MNVAVAAVFVVAAVAVAAVCAAVWWQRRLLVRRQVIVNLKSGTTFRGLLWSQRGRWVVLRQASMLGPGEDRTVDGEVAVDRRDVDFVQIL